MTGKEKIQATIELINERFKELVNGNSITISSDMLRCRSVPLYNQKAILDLLSSKDSFITYTEAYNYKSEADIEPSTILEIAELTDVDGFDERSAINDLLDSKTYTIKILENFATDIDIETPSSKSNNAVIPTRQLIKLVSFDVNSCTLNCGDKQFVIGDGSLEFFTCKFVFKNTKIAAKEEDILEQSTKNQNSQRAVRDAVNRINAKALKYFGIEKLLVLRAAKVRLNNIH